MKLNEGKHNVTYQINDINLEQKLKTRLASVGIYPNSEITIWQKKGSGTMVVKVMGSRWALGKTIVSGIEIQEAKGDGG